MRGGSFLLVRKAVDWRHPPINMEAASASSRTIRRHPPFCQGPCPTTSTSSNAAAQLAAPPARGRGAQPRQAAGRGPRGVHRGRGRRVARGHRPPRRRRDRDAVPQLPHAPGAARGGLRRRGRGDLPRGRRPRRRSRRGRRSSPGCAASPATRRRRRRWGRADGLPRRRGAGVPAVPPVDRRGRSAAARARRSVPARCAPTPS